MPKNIWTTIQLLSFHILIRWCSNSFKLGFSRWTESFQMYKMGFEETEEPEIKLPTFVGSWRKQGSSRRNISFCFIAYAKSLDSVDHKRLWKVLKEMGMPDHLLVSWETCMKIKKQQLLIELNMEQPTGSKLGKEYDKAIYCCCAYSTYMQSISCEILDWINHILQSRLPGEILTTSVMQMIYHSYGRKWRGTKDPPHEGERGEWKSWLEPQY